MSYDIETAIIPVAGVGTRMLPATWSIEKCMLPIYTTAGTRLLVDWMVDECSKAGLKRVIFVTTERGRRQLKDYFEDIDKDIENRFHDLGKTNLIHEEKERRSSYGIKFEYVIQGPGPYGTAVPPMLCKELLKGEKRFFLMGGDDFVYYQEPNTSELAKAIKTWESAGTEHVMMGYPVNIEEVGSLGILIPDSENNLDHWLERPKKEDIINLTNYYTNISRYGFSDSIWDYLEEEVKSERSDTEHYVTYPILKSNSEGHKFRIHVVRGKYLAGGNPDELIYASQYISFHMPYYKIKR